MSTVKGKTRKARQVTLDAGLDLDPKAATGADSPFLQAELIEQVGATLWLPEGLSEQKFKQRCKAAIALMEGIKPQTPIEGMLAVQMVATHSAAIECLRRAMIPDQTFAGRDQSLKHAAKLLSIYARQIEVLDKHRGKGQQKVTVEHVHVEAGGQAVVGNVEAGAGKPMPPKRRRRPRKSIAHAPEEPVNLEADAKSPVELKPD